MWVKTFMVYTPLIGNGMFYFVYDESILAESKHQKTDSHPFSKSLINKCTKQK